jgi:polyphosphate kinase 2
MSETPAKSFGSRGERSRRKILHHSLARRLALTLHGPEPARALTRVETPVKSHLGEEGALAKNEKAPSSGDRRRDQPSVPGVNAAREPMNPKDYDKALRELQVDLCALQEWVKHEGLRVVVVFEGRDAAGKGGTIKAITERVSPRVFRVVALPAPSDREKSQLYLQRYVPHLPAAGEIVIFDRSWYNRAGVEYVMGFCTKAQHRRFLILCPEFEHVLIDDGIVLVKFWLEVSDEEQERRFHARIKDPLRQWKLSPMDLASRSKWYEYSRARDIMFKATDRDFAPWTIVPSDDKRRARLNCIRHLLKAIPHKDAPRVKVKLPKRSTKGAYDDVASLKGLRFVKDGA